MASAISALVAAAKSSSPNRDVGEGRALLHAAGSATDAMEKARCFHRADLRLVGRKTSCRGLPARTSAIAAFAACSARHAVPMSCRPRPFANRCTGYIVFRGISGQAIAMATGPAKGRCVGVQWWTAPARRGTLSDRYSDSGSAAMIRFAMIAVAVRVALPARHGADAAGVACVDRRCCGRSVADAPADDGALGLPGDFSQATSVADRRRVSARQREDHRPARRGRLYHRVVMFPDDPTRRAFGISTSRPPQRSAQHLGPGPRLKWRRQARCLRRHDACRAAKGQRQRFNFNGFDSEHRGWAHDAGAGLDDDDDQLGKLDVDEGEHMISTSNWDCATRRRN